MKFKFGRSQIYSSPRFEKHPVLAKIFFKIFGYTSIGNYARSKVFIKVIKNLPIASFKKIMDLGCGYGEYSFMLAENLQQSEITGLEIAPERVERLEKARKDLELDNFVIHNDKIETMEKENYYDLIFSVDVFEHILKEEMPFSECHKKLKEGGYLLVKMPNIIQITILPNSWFGDLNQWLDDEHIGQVYNLKDLEERFAREGFKIVYKAYSDGWLSRLGWEIGYLARKVGGFPVSVLFLPFAKFLVILDNLKDNSKNGNAIQVIGQKVS